VSPAGMTGGTTANTDRRGPGGERRISRHQSHALMWRCAIGTWGPQVRFGSAGFAVPGNRASTGRTKVASLIALMTDHQQPYSRVPVASISCASPRL
jgi:hypothetical protein